MHCVPGKREACHDEPLQRSTFGCFRYLFERQLGRGHPGGSCHYELASLHGWKIALVQIWFTDLIFIRKFIPLVIARALDLRAKTDKQELSNRLEEKKK